jgi:hypothetical protein
LSAEQDLELKAAENEDFEEAERLNGKIAKIKQLIASKHALVKSNEDELSMIEVRKGDKTKDLQAVMAKGVTRLAELRQQQHQEMTQYADTEQLAVDEKRKRLHYERIRITESREEIRQ